MYKRQVLPYMVQHANTWLSTFATGRSAIDSVSVRAHLLPRNNPMSMLMDFVVGLAFPSLVNNDSNEYCEVIVKPNGIYVATENSKINTNAQELLASKFKFITSIVNKSFMSDARDKNYFLSLTLTSENNTLSEEYVYMSELNQLNTFIMHYAKGKDVNEILQKATKFLQFISFTDLPVDRPLSAAEWEAKQEPRVIIRSNFPTSQFEIDLLKEITSLVVEVVDNFTRDLVNKTPDLLITAEFQKKAKHLRTQELSKIVKEAKEAEAEELKEKRQDAERQRIRQLRKTGEQEKIDRKMKEKRERRMRNKQKQRM